MASARPAGSPEQELERRSDKSRKERAIAVEKGLKEKAAMREAMANPTRAGEPEPPTY